MGVGAGTGVRVGVEERREEGFVAEAGEGEKE